MSLFLRHSTTPTDDDSDEGGALQRQALEIILPDKNFDPDKVPTTGGEFLTRVAYERKNLPAVMSRKPAAKKLKTTNTATEISTTFTARIVNDQECAAHGSKVSSCTPAWKTWQLQHFQATRQQAHELRAKNVYGSTVETPTTADCWLEYCRKTPPVLKNILSLGQRDLENLLEAICDWLHRGDNNNNNDETPAAEDNEIDNGLELKVTTPWLGQWLYATFACLNLPLEPVVHSTMREIARIFVCQRAKVNVDEYQQINTYNIFMTIIANFFGQLDFEEFL